MPLCLCASFLLVLLTCSLLQGQEQKSAVKHVVLVSIDGLAASYLTDPRANLPNLRNLAAAGASAKGMLTSFPSVTWPSHTSLVTGVAPAKHGVIGNAVWDRKNNRPLTYIGDPELEKDQAVRVPTLYDAAYEAKLTCGSVIWPCCTAAKSLKWMIPDAGRPELHAKYTTPGFVEELGKAGVDISKLGVWGWNKQYSTERDVLYTKVANYLLEKHGVNLLLVHLVTPDGVEHNYGPHTPEAFQAVAESDERIGEILATLKKPPLAGKSTLFVVSDHGFAPYTKIIRPNVVLKQMGLITADGGKVMGRQAWCVAQGGSAFLYVLDESRRGDITKALHEKFVGVEGVAAVLMPQDFARLGLPAPDANSEAPHLVLTTNPGYSFAEVLDEPAIAAAEGLKGSHGHDPNPAYMHATFIAAGAGIKPGVKLDLIHNTDIAPTIAHLLGLTLKNVDGRVLNEILQSP